MKKFRKEISKKFIEQVIREINKGCREASEKLGKDYYLDKLEIDGNKINMKGLKL